MPPPRAVFRTFATLPRTKPPVLARSHPSAMPDRARWFCPPFAVPYEQGVLFFSPVDFDFRVREDGVDFRFPTEDGAVFERTVTDVGHVHIPDVSPSWDQECRELYRRRLAAEPLPPTFDLDEPDYPKQIVEVTREQGPDDYGYAISVWSGIVIELDPGFKLYVKEPPHSQFSDRGYRVLDALIESDRWHGHFGAVLHAHPSDTWLQVRSDQPLFQALAYPENADELVHLDVPEVPQHRFVDPLRWHVFDPYRRNSVRIGKYRNQLAKLPAWDCEWQAAAQRFEEQRAAVGPDTVLRRPTAAPTVTVDGGHTTLAFSSEDVLEAEGPALRPFLEGLGRSPLTFTTGDVLRWSQAGHPDRPTNEEVVEHLKTLVRHGLLTVENRAH